MLLSESTSKVSQQSLDRALLLAGVSLALLVALRSDCRAASGMVVQRPRWRRRTQAGTRRVLARRLRLAQTPRSRLPLLLSGTHRFLAALPPAWVLDLVAWAPPVVSASSVDSASVCILGNVIPAFLASRVLPDHRVRVVVLSHHAQARFSLLDLAAFPVDSLSEVCARYRDRLAAAAPNLEVGELLTGLSRARVDQVRRQVRDNAAR